MCEAEEGADIEDGLHLAFKKLKVDPEWNADMMLTPNKKSAVHHLWIREESRKNLRKKPNDDAASSKVEKSAELDDHQATPGTSTMDEPKESQPKLKIAVVKPTRRCAPYPQKDDVLSLSKLTFTDETCKKKSCSCSHKRQSSSNKGLFLNYARACVQSKYKVQQPVVRQARFRFHNKHKDHKSVIRAARLKILRTHPPKIGKPLPQGSNLSNQAIFGANHSKHKDFSFSALASNSEKEEKKYGNGKMESKSKEGAKPKSIKRFSGNSFEKHRSISVVTPYSIGGQVMGDAGAATKEAEGSSQASTSGETSALDMSSLTESLPSQNETVKKSEACAACPIHPRICLRPCTCAAQARLDPDDLTMDELACYFEDFVHIPKKMSSMAEMMYT